MENRHDDSEENLLSAIASGDQSAFVKLFNGYYIQVGNEMFRITGSLDLAERTVQDAFVMVWLQREMLVNIKECWGYLLAISSRIALAAITEQKRRREGLTEDTSAHPLAVSRELIKQAVEQLPSLQKQIYIMTSSRRLSVREIGALLDITPDQVKKIMYNGLRSVRMQLSAYMSPCVAVVLTSVLVLGD